MNNWQNLNRDDLIYWLEQTDTQLLQQLYDAAYQVKKQYVGTNVYFRGIIEFSNICAKNCYYCGIRKDNQNVQRYRMTLQEIEEQAKWCDEMNYGSIVLQSGEREDEEFVSFVEQALKRIHNATGGKLGVTLSLGEQTYDTYKRWSQAGAHRYLLRIESSDPALYQSLHPANHNHSRRLQCLADLKALDYQVGTGVMIGLPGQSSAQLADDIIFFKEHDIDMIGMGPYVVHHDTPLAAKVTNYNPKRQLQLAITMIALTRLYLKDVNIASTTALQALDPVGREMGLKAGANIIMPVLTDLRYRGNYLLYEGKPCLDEGVQICRDCLERRVINVGEAIGWGERGDSPHWHKRRDNA